MDIYLFWIEDGCTSGRANETQEWRFSTCGMGRSKKKANDDSFLRAVWTEPYFFDTLTSQACCAYRKVKKLIVNKRKPPNIGLDSETSGRRLLAVLGSQNGISQWAGMESEAEEAARQVQVQVSVLNTLDMREDFRRRTLL